VSINGLAIAMIAALSRQCAVPGSAVLVSGENAISASMAKVYKAVAFARTDSANAMTILIPIPTGRAADIDSPEITHPQGMESLVTESLLERSS
jgi:hypothetical protein